MAERSTRVLIVEDDLTLSEVFKELLELAGCNVETASTGEAAVEQLASSHYDTVFLDLHLPRMSGDEVLEYIRSTPAISSTRVVIITADEKAAKNHVKLGKADLVLLKPLMNLSVLIDALKA